MYVYERRKEMSALNGDYSKIVVLDKHAGKEIAVITNDLITTADDNIVIEVTSATDGFDIPNSTRDIIKILCNQLALLAEKSKSGLYSASEVVEFTEQMLNIAQTIINASDCL